MTPTICGGAAPDFGGRAAGGALLGFALADGAPAAAPPATPKDDALANQAEALSWLGASLLGIQTVRNLIQRGLSADFKKLETMLEFQALKTHFHIDRHPDPTKFLFNLGRTFGLMPRRLTS